MDLPALLTDYTLQVVATGAAMLGAVSGALGTFAVLRRQSLLGDAISHAALPGIVLAYLVTGSKSTLVLVIGAAIAGWIGTLVVMGVVGSSRIKQDSALGLVLSVFFGLGLVLLTYVQQLPRASQAGLDRFLFGQAATLLERDLVVIGGLGAVAVLAMLLAWKEFKLLSFDRDFGATLGFPMRVVDVALTSVLVLAIVIGLQTVGVVLMSAMVVAPGAAARQWSDHTGRVVGLAALFGATGGVSGALISSTFQRTPTGPTIVLCLSALVLVSLMIAPRRGVVWEAIRRVRQRRTIRSDAVLRDLWELERQHERPGHGHAVAALEAMRMGHGNVPASLRALRESGLAEPAGGGTWVLTEAGRREVEDAGAEEQR